VLLFVLTGRALPDWELFPDFLHSADVFAQPEGEGGAFPLALLLAQVRQLRAALQAQGRQLGVYAVGYGPRPCRPLVEGKSPPSLVFLPVLC
jgi:hypothetical protein